MALSAHTRPLTDSMALAYAYDPAFDAARAEFPVGKDGDDEAYISAWKSATERLDYSTLIKSNETPTLFRFRPLSDAESRKLHSLPIGVTEMLAVVVRMTLQSVHNGGEFEKFERKVDPALRDLGKIVTVPYMDMLGALSLSFNRPLGEITTSLGGIVYQRSLNLDPK